MGIKKAVTISVGFSLFGTIALAGRSGGGGGQTPVKDDGYNNEPVTLKFFSHNAGVLADEDLEALVGKPVKAKYPNITVELVKDTTLDKLIAGGEVPDVILTSNYYLHDLLEKGLGSDLNDFIKQQNIDFSQFEPEVVNVLKKFGKNGEMYGIPYAMNYGLILYNKDIFDKFAVPYPKDGMTWTETLELARKLTRTDQGTQYIGIDLGDPQPLTRAYSLPVVDEKQEKAVLTTEGYRRVFGIYEKLYQIPGMVGSGGKYSYGIDNFIKEQKTAMYPYWLSAVTARVSLMKDINWDIVSFPSFDDKPGLGREVDFHLAMVTPNSNNKNAAYAVLKTLVSTETERAMNRGTRLTVLKDPALKKEVSADTKLYEGKNLQGIFTVKPAPAAGSHQVRREAVSVPEGGGERHGRR
ncbi:extracellular solute-binding protein [Paenibacillus sp. P25]|nr:extracellular solute-binding protein [Paenibacillus sp. P25]